MAQILAHFYCLKFFDIFMAIYLERQGIKYTQNHVFYTFYPIFYTRLYLKIKGNMIAHGAFHPSPKTIINRKQAYPENYTFTRLFNHLTL